jgi:ketosteroid isomerase-like protein
MNHAFVTYCAKDGVVLIPGSMPVVGYEAVNDIFRKRDNSAIELTWEPVYAKVAKSGDLGYSYGVYSSYDTESDTTRKGTYVSVWIRENGKWKFALDSGNEGVGD